uniref:Uncharacterized protein n=1 Tax=Astatotilapia calliptera TaxID=8154 RepID=A0A3P8NFS0_ASTCA
MIPDYFNTVDVQALGRPARDSTVCFSIQRKSKISAARRLALKTKLLKTATVMLEDEKEQKKLKRETTLRERVPPLQLSGLSLQDLQALCKELHQKIDVVDEERYDSEVKVAKNNKEVFHSL